MKLKNKEKDLELDLSKLNNDLQMYSKKMDLLHKIDLHKKLFYYSNKEEFKKKLNTLNLNNENCSKKFKEFEIKDLDLKKKLEILEKEYNKFTSSTEYKQDILRIEKIIGEIALKNNNVTQKESLINEVSEEINNLNNFNLNKKISLLKSKLGDKIEFEPLFNNVEWKNEINEDIERILFEFNDALIVNSFESAKELSELYDGIIFVGFYEKNKEVSEFIFEGNLANEKETIIYYLLNEWENVSNFNYKFNKQINYNKEIYCYGQYKNKYIEHNFIGKKGIINKIKNLNKKKENYILEMNSITEEINNLNKEKNLLELKNKKINSLINDNEINKKLCLNEMKQLLKDKNDLNLNLIDIKKELEITAKEYDLSKNEFEKNVSEISLRAINLDKECKTSEFHKEMFKSSEREVIQYRDVGNNVKELYEKKRVELEEFQKKVSNNENIAEFDVNKVFEELRQYENEIRKYLRKINVILESLLSNFNASARLELDSRLDENNYEYFSGIRIYATFADRNEIEIEDEDIDLSGGQKTKLIICILLALIKSNSIKKEIPFLLLDEFDAQLDEKSHIDVLNLLKNEVGAKQIIILSPNRIAPKALFAEQFFLFTNSESEEPKIKLIAIKNKNVMS